MSKEKDVDRLIIVKLSAIGDVVHALPCLRYIRQRFPKVYIVWIVEEKARELLEGNRHIDEIIVIDTNRWRKEIFTASGFLKTIKEIYGCLKKLRAVKADVAIDIQGLIKSGVIAFLSNAGIRIGFHPLNCREKANAIFMTEKARLADKDMHIVEKNLLPLELLGIHQNGAKKDFTISVPYKLITEASAFLKNKGIASDSVIVGVNPGAGWETKLWELKRYAMLTDMLFNDLLCKVILLWGNERERNMVKDISSMCISEPIIPYKCSIKQLCALISSCTLIIGTDTGPIHMADAIGIPTISLFGPSSPQRNRPYNSGVTIYGRCDRAGCYKRRCSNFICMDSISVDEVFDKVKVYLTRIFHERTL